MIGQQSGSVNFRLHLTEHKLNCLKLSDRLAERCAAAMYERDRASKFAGMALDAIAPGYARLSMMIVPEMLQGHGTAHGGAIFALADSAFAFACNTRDLATVAQHCTISYITPGRDGDHLVAEAKETNLAGRFGIYDVTVRAGDRVVAIFRGHSAALRTSILPEGAS